MDKEGKKEEKEEEKEEEFIFLIKTMTLFDWMQAQKHISLHIVPCIIVYVTNKATLIT